MKIPNADQAIIAVEKLRDYLLNPLHRRGGSKARLLMLLGYDADRWQTLEMDLRRQHLMLDAASTAETEYGTSYEIIAPLTGPNGRSVRFRSVWQIDYGTQIPRLITLYPD